VPIFGAVLGRKLRAGLFVLPPHSIRSQAAIVKKKLGNNMEIYVSSSSGFSH